MTRFCNPTREGIDVHRKRSQVAVVDQSGEVLANRNVPKGRGRFWA
jgi:hypothetical protein